MRPVHIIFCVAGILIGTIGTAVVMTYNRSDTSGPKKPQTAKNRMEQLRKDAKETTRDVLDQKAIAAEMRILESVEVGIKAEVIIEKLKTVKKDSPKYIQRRVILFLELLADIGPPALPAIREFLVQDQDVEYISTRDLWKIASKRRHPVESIMLQPLDRPEFLCPHSLRLGLIEVLYRMGTPRAEAILVETLKTTGRGIEVAQLDVYLEAMVSDKYRDLVLQTAKGLLKNPVNIVEPSILDHRWGEYLFALLLKYKDDSLSGLAQENLITSTGRLNPITLRYVYNLHGANSIEKLLPLFRDNKLSDKWDQRALRQLCLLHVGESEGANQFFRDALQRSLKSKDRLADLDVGFTMNSLTKAPGKMHPSQLSPNILQNRLNLLKSVEPLLKGTAFEDKAQYAHKVLNYWLKSQSGQNTQLTKPR